jgi:hypothetical protein
MNGGGRGGDNRGNRRRSFKRWEKDNDRNNQWQNNSGSGGKKAGENQKSGDGKFEKKRGGFYERPRWTPPELSAEPIPAPKCPYCGKIIKEMASALSDKNTGEPVHFDCVIAKISENETLEPGDTISYIGGGRFGIIRFNNPPGFSGERDARNRPEAAWFSSSLGTRDFKIKKILEWENKEERAEWRRIISEHFSVT